MIYPFNYNTAVFVEQPLQQYDGSVTNLSDVCITIVLPTNLSCVHICHYKKKLYIFLEFDLGDFSKVTFFLLKLLFQKLSLVQWPYIVLPGSHGESICVRGGTVCPVFSQLQTDPAQQQTNTPRLQGLLFRIPHTVFSVRCPMLFR